jgi:hypothetical protein
VGLSHDDPRQGSSADEDAALNELLPHNWVAAQPAKHKATGSNHLCVALSGVHGMLTL